MVLLADSLFVTGISSTFEVNRIRVWTLSIGASILAGAVVWMAVLPMGIA